MNFLIFSLPRSGSAWLSNFLTYADCFCWHEPLSEKESLARLFKRRGSGGVDTLAYTRPALRSQYRSFVLKRDIGQIEASSRLCGVDYKAPKCFSEVTHGLPEIHYNQLSDVSYLAKIWCKFSNTAFDEDRARLLVNMNVQRDLENFRRTRPHFSAQIESLRC